MKILFAVFILFFISNLTYGQKDSLSSDTTDSKKITRGFLEPKLISDKSISDYVLSELSQNSRDYIINNKIKGKIQLIIHIDKAGKPKEIKVVKGLQFLVDNDVVNVFKKSKWIPGKLDGEPVNYKLSVPITFD